MAVGASSSGLTSTVNRDKIMAQSTTGSPDESDLNSQSAETSDMLVMDMVDGLIRRFHELECVHKLTNTGVRRKHFFETDFVVSAIAA